MTLDEARIAMKTLHKQRGEDFKSAAPPYGTLQIMGEMIGIQNCMEILDRITHPGDEK